MIFAAPFPERPSGVRDRPLCVTGAKVSADEENSKYGVDQRRLHNVRMHASSEIQQDHGHGVNKFFKNSDGYERSISNRILRDHHEYELPQKRYAKEAVIEFRVGDRRRRVAAHLFEKKIQRQQRNESIDRRDAVHNSCEFHLLPSSP